MATVLKPLGWAPLDRCLVSFSYTVLALPWSLNSVAGSEPVPALQWDEEAVVLPAGLAGVDREAGECPVDARRRIRWHVRLNGLMVLSVHPDEVCIALLWRVPGLGYTDRLAVAPRLHAAAVEVGHQ